GLAHTRLAVIDLEGGRQPMTKRLGEYGLTIVYTGELYNTDILKNLLSLYPLKWETNSDTEVVLNGYLAMGIDFIKNLNGAFAFAIYDEKKDTLILARDPLGGKPLFIHRTAECFLFGSEQKALFAYGIKPRVDRESFCEVLGLGPARTPGHGVFCGINELKPGRLLIKTPDYEKEVVYFELNGEEHTDSYQETVEKVSWLVRDSVKRQMVSDVPICTFLSGGLDSSLVTALCQAEMKKEGKVLNTFSFSFAGNNENFVPNDYQSSLDRPFVDIMVNALGSKHRYLECNNEIQADYLYKAVDARDLPCMADIESSLLYFCSVAAKECKVALTGECADEIFGGYPWFRNEKMWQNNTFPWSSDLSVRTAFFKEDFLGTLGLTEYVQKAYDDTVAETPRFEGDSEIEAKRREIAWLNIRWFMETLLNRMNRASVYSGLEARVPYADSRILKYAYNIPWEMKYQKELTKNLLIETGKGILPQEVLFRKKSPYPKTYDLGYEKIVRERLKERITDPSSPLSKIIDNKKLEAFMAGNFNYGAPWYGQLMAGPQMLAYLIQVDYWMCKYRLSA
ncbi:MAG: asparagine synthase (glutamine-hydrolyzing), partial [Lachnospiraceae bacterium]|nr:asparagine synthase (glutamine-hydrolyzing) [Lachnospiraceae bacterium]